MFATLKQQIQRLLSRARTLKPQTERQLAHYLQDHGGTEAEFLARAPSLLEEHDLEILFAPSFTPELDEQAAVSEVLASWRPTAKDIERLNAELSAEKTDAVLELADGTHVRLPLHEVMVSRYIKLLRLDQAPDFAVASSLQDALPSDLYQAALALMRQRGFTRERQVWFAAFVKHLARQPLSVGVLSAAADFIVAQTATDTPTLLAAAKELVRVAKSSADYAQAGRIYWSPDVAQHHQYRGQGQVDEVLVKQRLAELGALEAVAAGLETF
jgi:hypothetical protein